MQGVRKARNKNGNEKERQEIRNARCKKCKGNRKAMNKKYKE